MPIKNDVPHALVQGWSKAPQKILAQFESDLRECILKMGIG
jgi:hypothetical protein